MIVSEKFTYIHLPKTGGTFVEQALDRAFEATGAWFLDTARPADRRILGTEHQHESVREIPPEHRQKPVLTSIRSPYDWYVSHYEFAWWKIDPGDLFDDAAVRTRFLSYPELEFGDFVHAINDWRVLPQAWREFARQMEAARIGWLSWDSINRLAWHPEPVLEIPPRLAQGQHLPANSHHPEVRFLRTSMLNEDLHAFLLGQGFRASDVDFVLTLDRVYPKEGGRHPAVAWRDYYDAELQAFVRQREHVLFDLFPEFDVVEDLAK